MIGLSTNYYATQGYSIYESVAKTVELGFEVIEFGPAHSFEEDVWSALEKIKRDFPQIAFTVHTLFPPLRDKVWFNPSDGLTGNNRTIIDGLFEAADILDAMMISIHPAVFNKVTLGKKGPGNFDGPVVGYVKEAAICTKNFMEVMGYINRKSEKHGIRALIENLDTTFAKTYPATKDHFDMVFARFFHTGLLLDVGHAMQCGYLPELMKLDGHILEIHLHDIERVSKGRKMAHLPIKNLTYFKPIKKIFENEKTVLIFEHGANVTEDEILREKEMLQNFTSA